MPPTSTRDLSSQRRGALPAGSTLEPLVDLLCGELCRAGIRVPGPRPATAVRFTRWYLQVIQLLEAHVAGTAGQAPIARDEVELMCRCALTAPTLRAAMELCATFCRSLHPRAGRVAIRRGRGELAFHLDSLRPETTGASSLCDITGLFAFHQLFQWLAGADLQLRQVGIGPLKRDDVLPFLRLFRAPVLAGGADYALHFPEDIEVLPVIRTPAEFEAFFATYPCSVFDTDVNDLSQQVAALLTAALRQGRGLPTQAAVARGLGIPLSTFRHRLTRSRTSFRSLRDQCLREYAEGLLNRGDLGVADIASRLGFSDAAAFRRCFRRWHGCAPSAWRRQAQRTG